MIKQTDIKQIVHRVLTAAEIRHNRTGMVTDLFRPEIFDAAMEQVRATLEDIEGVRVQPRREARVEVKDGARAEGVLTAVRDYLPSNYEAYIVSSYTVGVGEDADVHEYIEVVGYDDHGWTLDGYVIPRLASALIWAEEVK